MGLRGRLMGAALRLSGLFLQQRLETASRGTASSTPQGTPDSLAPTRAKALEGAQMPLITFKLLSLENLWFCVKILVCISQINERKTFRIVEKWQNGMHAYCFSEYIYSIIHIVPKHYRSFLKTLYVYIRIYYMYGCIYNRIGSYSLILCSPLFDVVNKFQISQGIV